MRARVRAEGMENGELWKSHQWAWSKKGCQIPSGFDPEEQRTDTRSDEGMGRTKSGQWRQRGLRQVEFKVLVGFSRRPVTLGRWVSTVDGEGSQTEVLMGIRPWGGQ